MIRETMTSFLVYIRSHSHFKDGLALEVALDGSKWVLDVNLKRFPAGEWRAFQSATRSFARECAELLEESRKHCDDKFLLVYSFSVDSMFFDMLEDEDAALTDPLPELASATMDPRCGFVVAPSHHLYYSPAEIYGIPL